MLSTIFSRESRGFCPQNPLVFRCKLLNKQLLWYELFKENAQTNVSFRCGRVIIFYDSEIPTLSPVSLLGPLSLDSDSQLW